MPSTARARSFNPAAPISSCPENSVIVFADDEPLWNWGHPCRYLLHDPETGALTGDRRSAPAVDGVRERLHPVPHSDDVRPSRALNWPIVQLPPWIFTPEWALRWHVILYSGASMNRHLNDLEFLYRTLIYNYRVPLEYQCSAVRRYALLQRRRLDPPPGIDRKLAGRQHALPDPDRRSGHQREPRKRNRRGRRQARRG